MSCHPKLGKTKAQRFPELSVSLLRSLEETQRLASTVARGNSASRFYGRSTGRVVG
ncbi:hypothetical protein [Leptospira noguchii]|uniref:hypothetical protein n=1 Tax=Leptospira noguchii TaxID=28182 RepID=UPI0002EC3295|nr:hypothetical protein [Leptospira noguchii]UOG47718.1 hypothetical protein MAL00_11605 [Leptospira noguchii]